jgi:predicted amidohydrolase
MSTSSSKPIAAIAQLRSTSNKLQNLKDIAVCARQAKKRGACILFLPECFGFMGESAQQTLQEAEDPEHLQHTTNPINDEIVSNLLKATISDDRDEDDSLEKDDIIQNGPKVKSVLCGLRTIAIESGLWISGGGVHIAGASPDPETGTQRVYNTHVILNEKGVVQCLYRKIHLFDVSIPGKVDLRESKTTAAGIELVTCESPIGTLGVTICYDLRFPEQYISLVKKGAQILLVPSAFTVPTGAAHWHTLLKGTMTHNISMLLAPSHCCNLLN